MAEGTTINAQVNLGNTECDLCGTYKNVRWKCGNCDETLCEQCKTAHHKSKVSRHHVIIELKDASQQIPGSGVFCQQHPKEVLSMYCTTCGYLICLDCIKGDHRQHQFDKITDVIDNKKKEVHDILDQAKQITISSLATALQSMIENRTNYNQETDRVIAEITTKAEELKKEIDKIRDKLIRNLETRRKEDQKYLEEKRLEMEEILNKMREVVRKSEERIKNPSDLEIFQTLDDIKQVVTSMKSIPVVPEVIPPVFVPGPFDQKELEKICGHIVDKSVGHPEMKPDINVSIVSSFVFENDMWTMKVVNPNEALIGVHRGKHINLVNRKGQVVKKLQKNNQTNKIDIAKSGDILATTLDGHLINRITQSDVVSAFANMSPYTTHGIHVSKDGDVLVGLKKDGKGRLARLSSTGQTLQVIEYDDSKFRLYDSPSYITQNINGDIWVSDTYFPNPRVTVVDDSGKYRFTYKGPTNVKKESKFCPRGIVNNQYGQILIADFGNNTIHLVDKDGGFLQYILTKQDDIVLPCALSVDDDGMLWAGCWNGKVIVVNYLSKT